MTNWSNLQEKGFRPFLPSPNDLCHAVRILIRAEFQDTVLKTVCATWISLTLASRGREYVVHELSFMACVPFRFIEDELAMRAIFAESGLRTLRADGMTPDLCKLVSGIARIHIKRNRQDDAIKILSFFEDVTPADMANYGICYDLNSVRLLASLYKEKNQLDKAKDLLQKWLDGVKGTKLPQKTGVVATEYYFSITHDVEATEHFLSSMLVQPLAEYYMLLGEEKLAWKLLERALPGPNEHFSPTDDTLVVERLAVWYSRNNQRQAAIKLIKDYLQCWRCYIGYIPLVYILADLYLSDNELPAALKLVHGYFWNGSQLSLRNRITPEIQDRHVVQTLAKLGRYLATLYERDNQNHNAAELTKSLNDYSWPQKIMREIEEAN